MILSDRFNSLDPLSLDNFRAVEVFKLVKNLNTYIDNLTASEAKNAVDSMIQAGGNQ